MQDALEYCNRMLDKLKKENEATLKAIELKNNQIKALENSLSHANSLIKLRDQELAELRIEFTKITA